MQTSSFNAHAQDTSPTQAYTTLETIGALTPDAHWEKEENAIKQVLGSTLSNMAFNRIKASANVHDAWETLRRVYEEQSKALVTNLIWRFWNKHCDEDKSIRLHFEYLADLREQLAAMGKSVIDKDYTDMLLASLPASYDRAVSFISASAHLGSKALMAEIFEQLILDESKWQQVKDRYVESRDEAQAADSGKQKGKDKSKDKKKVECYNCCKTRHYKSECWAKGGGKEGQGLWQGRGAKDDAAPAIEQLEETEA
jgi:gag-polypeptide of LTR copia-type